MSQVMIALGILIAVAALSLGVLTALDMRTERAKGTLAVAAAARDVKKRSKKGAALSKLDRHVAEAGIDMSGRAWMGAVAIATLAVALIAQGAVGALPVTAATALAALAASEVFLRFKKRARAREFDEQLARALPQIAQNMRAGINAERAVRSVAENSPEPLATELRRVSAEASITADLAGAFQALSERTGSKDVLMIATAVRIVKTQGGSLADILENVAGVVERRQEMVRYAATQTASTKATALVLVAMTAGLAIMQSLAQEGFLEFYRDNPVGWAVIVAALVLELVGYAAICKIADVKVD